MYISTSEFLGPLKLDTAEGLRKSNSGPVIGARGEVPFPGNACSPLRPHHPSHGYSVQAIRQQEILLE
jgi:hypothetical protein